MEKKRGKKMMKIVYQRIRDANRGEVYFVSPEYARSEFFIYYLSKILIQF